MPVSNPADEPFESPVAGAEARALLRGIMAAPALLLQFGCATGPDAIAPAPVPAAQYLQLGCADLAAEQARVNSSLRDAQGLQAGQAERDSGSVAAAFFLFTPIIMAVGGNSSMAGEVARLKGERAALEDAMDRKGCPKTQ